MNPLAYEIPEGPTQISFSGGRTSAFMLHNILEANNGLPEDCVVTFANTGREMPETLDFVQECSDKWSVPIAWLEYDRTPKVTYKITDRQNAAENGEPFVKLLKAKKFMPSPMSRFCTTELKMFTIKRYVVNHLKWKNWNQAVGIRFDEGHRMKASSKDRWQYWYPLFVDQVTKEIVGNFWKAQEFDLQLPNHNGKTPSGNCDFCFLKSEDSIAYMLRHHPDRAKWWNDIEKEMGFPFRLDRNLDKMKEEINRQGDWIFDMEDFFCQTDDGECTG